MDVNTQNKTGFVELGEVSRLPRNPKDHDIGEVSQSVERWGFLGRVIINKTTGHLLAGHGRVELLERMKRAKMKPPKGITVDEQTGKWLVPFEWEEVPEDEEEAVAVALNRTEEIGGWDEAQLAEVLSELAGRGEDMLVGTGFDMNDLDDLLERLNHNPFDEEKEQPDEIISQYAILVSCDDETQQTELLERFVEEGLRVRALLS